MNLKYKKKERKIDTLIYPQDSDQCNRMQLKVKKTYCKETIYCHVYRKLCFILTAGLKSFCAQDGALIILADFVYRERFAFKTSKT